MPLTADLVKLDKKYEKDLEKAAADLGAAQDALTALQMGKENTRQKLVEYYDASAAKVGIDAIVAAGPPVI